MKHVFVMLLLYASEKLITWLALAGPGMGANICRLFTVKRSGVPLNRSRNQKRRLAVKLEILIKQSVDGPVFTIFTKRLRK